ncbi:regulator of (H+)-ATPase in vacuolar membrane, partial [Ceratobasidium sp. 394]
MLRLCQSLPGQHESDSKPAVLVLPRDGQLVLAYPSFDVINILEAKTLRFLQSIDFTEAIPRNNDGATHVACVACDQDLNLLFGASGKKVAVWTPSSSFRNRNLFRVHSTLVHLSDVRFMSSRKGILAIAGSNEITVYHLDSEQDLPKWSPTCTFRLSGCLRPEVSPGLTRLACIAQDKHRVHVHSLENRRRLQSITHIKPVEDIAWRSLAAPHSSDVVLFTITVDSTVRIFLPVLDSPDHLQLHASVDSHAFGVPRNVGIASRICWLDRDAVAAALSKNFEKILEGAPENQEEETARRNRLKTIVDEGWDLFAVVTGDGTVIVRAVTNIDRRPPTLLHQFATLHSPPQTVLNNTRQLSFHYEPASSSTFMLTAPQLHSYSVLPVSFFDAQAYGARKSSHGQAGRGSMQPIKYFVRTASGMAFALCYEDGGGEVWKRHPSQDLSHLTPHHISDSIWLAGGALLVGAGHQMFLHDTSKDPNATQNGKEEHNSMDLFELVASQNGPLEDHHPQMLLQCLLWGKIELVKEIIVRLAASFDAAEDAGGGQLYFTRVSPWEFLSGRSSYDSVLTWSSTTDDDDPNSFSRKLVECLLRKLEERRLPHLSKTEQAHLIVMIQTTLEIDEQRRSLDANGLRYLISIRSFYTLNKRLELSNKSPEINGFSSGRTGKRDRLRYRDIVWAFHSESQQIMLGASTEACGGRMTWADAKALGVFLWTRSSEDLKNQMEVLARNQYMIGDRDPVSCSLFYFALGKVKLVHGLWRQAVWHKDHALMIKFLSNDFTESRWRTAALKNAFALLSKQRFEFAAAFFMLGGSLQDAVNVCLKQLDDFQLAIALARVVEGDNGPVLRGILSKAVVPLAFESGNRWLGSWAFWMLDRRDLSVRILLTPLGQFAASLKDIFEIGVIGDPHFDDPSLALLFAQLKSKSLQTVKGVSEISGRTEFNFVLQMARVFCRMGCHPLALALTTSWSFARPTLPTQGTVRRNSNVSSSSEQVPASPTFSRKADLQPRRPIRAHVRRKSLIMDMDISALPPTRTVSPVPEVSTPQARVEEPPNPMDTQNVHEKVEIPKRTGLGSLMQAAKQE